MMRQLQDVARRLLRVLPARGIGVARQKDGHPGIAQPDDQAGTVAPLGRLVQLRLGAGKAAIDAVEQHLLPQRKQRHGSMHGHLKSRRRRKRYRQGGQPGSALLFRLRHDVREQVERAIQAGDGLLSLYWWNHPPRCRRWIVPREQSAYREAPQNCGRAADVVKMQMRQQQQIDVVDPRPGQIGRRLHAAGVPRMRYRRAAAVHKHDILFGTFASARRPVANKDGIAVADVDKINAQHVRPARPAVLQAPARRAGASCRG